MQYRLFSSLVPVVQALSSISPTYSGSNSLLPQSSKYCKETPVVNVFAQKSLLSLISPIILEVPPSYLVWFHNTGISSPKNSSLLDQGKRTLRGEALQTPLIPSVYEHERSEIWEGGIVMQNRVTVSALQGAKNQQKTWVAAVQSWPLYKTNIWLLHHHSERNTHNIQLEEPQNQTVMKSLLSRGS